MNFVDFFPELVYRCDCLADAVDEFFFNKQTQLTNVILLYTFLQ